MHVYIVLCIGKPWENHPSPNTVCFKGIACFRSVVLTWKDFMQDQCCSLDQFIQNTQLEQTAEFAELTWLQAQLLSLSLMCHVVLDHVVRTYLYDIPIIYHFQKDQPTQMYLDSAGLLHYKQQWPVWLKAGKVSGSTRRSRCHVPHIIHNECE